MQWLTGARVTSNLQKKEERPGALISLACRRPFRYGQDTTGPGDGLALTLSANRSRVVRTRLLSPPGRDGQGFSPLKAPSRGGFANSPTTL
jgi:hypothetical protein